MKLGECLVQDDTDCVIEDTLAENDRVEMRVDLVLVKDGKNSDRVGSGECGAEDKAFDKREGWDKCGRSNKAEEVGEYSVDRWSSRVEAGCCAPPYPIPIAEIKVPRNAKVKIEPKFRKNCSCGEKCESMAVWTAVKPTCFSSYPELRMMGGSSRLKNSVCLNF